MVDKTTTFIQKYNLFVFVFAGSLQLQLSVTKKPTRR